MFVECSTAGRNDAGVVVGTLVSLSCVRVHVFGAAAVRCGRCGAVRSVLATTWRALISSCLGKKR